MAELFGALVLGDQIVDTAPGGASTPLIVAIAHPRPASNIGINRVLCRTHVLSQPAGIYATVLLLLRASDGTILGGAVTDTVSVGTPTEITHLATLADREFLYDPNYYRLNIGDSLLAHFTTYGLGQYAGPQPSNKLFKASLDILVGYYTI